MAAAPLSESLPLFRRTNARVLGVLGSVLALALAALGTVALNDGAHRHFDSAILLLALFVALRWALSFCLQQWDEQSASRLRALWRSGLGDFLAMARPRHELGGSDVALAIERVALAPSLERLRFAASSSLLGLLIIFFAAGWLPLVVTVALLVVAGPLYWRAGLRSAAMAVSYNERRAVLESRQLELLQNATELRGLGAVPYGVQEIGAISQSEHRVALRALRVALESSLVTEFLSGVSIGLVAMVVGFGLLNGHISLVRALMAVLVTGELFVQVRRFGAEFHRRDDLALALATLHRTPDAIGESSDTLISLIGVVTVANDVPVSLGVRAGDRITILGPSGSGKTSLLRTALGMLEPKSGAITRTADGIGFISAESTLLTGSLRENLALNEDVADAHLHSLLAQLGLAGERFEDLGQQLELDGRGISAGERVRLLLARAIIATPKVLVLDDIAGVLDNEARTAVGATLAGIGDVAIIEASVDAPLLTTSVSIGLTR